MIDGHIHIEKQLYNEDLINNMVNVALQNHIDELHIVEHTHKFIEFSPIYEPIKKDPATWLWYSKKKLISIKEYIDFIDKIKQHRYPVRIKFGLEVCYFSETEEILRNIISNYHFDFLIGSIHYVDGFGFDLNRDSWRGKDIDLLYKKYFETEEKAIQSRLFDYLGHPDAIKIFSYYPSFDLNPYYERIASLLERYNIKTENNSGFARYGFTNYGLNRKFKEILNEHHVEIVKSSDAHKYLDIGNKFSELD